MVTNVFEIQGVLTLIVIFVLLAIKIFAFVNCLFFPAEAYEAAGKLTKPAWALILGLGVVISVFSIGFIISVAFTIAALVYLVDVRPALSGLRRR